MSKMDFQPLSDSFNLQGTEHCACSHFRKAARIVTQLFDAALKPAGIRSTQFALLVTIAKLAPVPIGRLGRVLVIDRTTLSRSLGLLEKEGFVTISRRSNMRRRFVELSRKGLDELVRSLPFWRDAQRHFVDGVGEQHWRSMQRELEKLPGVAFDVE